MTKYLYLCDGKACDKNCAENGFEHCTHTKDENHARNKIRRNRQFISDHGAMIEKEH